MSLEIYDSDFDDEFQEQQAKRELSIQEGKRMYVGSIDGFGEGLTDPEDILQMHHY